MKPVGSSLVLSFVIVTTFARAVRPVRLRLTAEMWEAIAI
jgi:hypothetical protein